tara:strand:- start:2867 stop:3910 length:1044 start_codon:yes stop_codon:yes gene_type:complete
MKRICIIGNNIISLYNALKYNENNIEIHIYEKKNNIEYINTNDNYVFCLFNDNHKSYINLLKKFSIKYSKINLQYNDKIYNIINMVIDKSKLLPNNISNSYSFIELCKNFLSNSDYDYINNIANNNNILNYINGNDFINIINNDLNKKLNFYYIKEENINELINKLLIYLNKNNNIKFFYNTKINKINYNSRDNFFILNDNIIKYNYIISTISKKNLIELNIWNQNQIRQLNSVVNINMYNVKELIDIIINIDNLMIINNQEYDIKELLLNNLQFIYPQLKNKNKKLSIWKTYDNNNIHGKIMFRERVKFLYNNKFYLCNLGYSSSNIFINYIFDNIDKTNFIKKKK